ncbi:tRNA-modifying protein YgfZ [Neptunicella sp. SCSIO 80796]|uniref:tRNA-modifying protein YgfZ n=1 Tax=Neptunicella plasticusilytica TaxID=3117012 RepID=UPI003A4D21CD
MSEFITQLNHLGVINLTGEERVKYLQGQVTNDIQELTEHKAALGCHCDFKGKTWNIFYAVQWQDQIHLISDKDGIAGSLPELKKYAVFAKTEISEQSDQYLLLGGTGSAFQQLIENFFGAVPDADLAMLSNQKGLVLSLTSPQPRWLVMLKNDSAATFVKDTAITEDDQQWQRLDIQAGLAHISQQTSNQFVPQMLNMQALGAISFSKGCYMGQEVVARTKYLGKNKRATFILRSEQACTLNAGDTLELQIEQNWRRGGTVISCATVNHQTWLLAVLANDTEVGATLRSKEQPDMQFNVQPLPYSIDN